jgi:hypothetical protein
LTSLSVVTERQQTPAYATFGSFPSVTAPRSSYFEVVGRAGNGIIVVNTLDPAGRRGFLFLECLDVCRFSDAGMTGYPRGVTAGVRKAPRHEIAGRGTDWAVPRAQLWGFGRVRATAGVGSKVG